MRRTLPVLSFASFCGLVLSVNGLLWGQQPSADKIAATVNGEKILVSEVKQLLRNDRPPVHPLTAAQKKEIWQMALDMLINDSLMRQFLAKNAPRVPAQQIDREIGELKKALEKKQTTFQKFLAETHQTEAMLKADIVARFQWRSYVNNRLPDGFIKKYYDQNKVFFDKVFVRASHILLKVPDKAGDAEKKAIYDQLNKVRDDILQGKVAFADAAKKYSTCPSKDKGGDIGHFPYKFAVAEPFSRTAFAMKVNQLSPIVATEFGYHIILVTERTAGEPSNFETMKDFVRDVYAQEVQLFQSVIDDQKSKSKIQVFEANMDL